MISRWNNLPREKKAEYERKAQEAEEENEGEILPTGNGGNDSRLYNNTLHVAHIMTKDKDGQLLIAINAMSQFKGKSLEELRDEDYNLLDDPSSLCESDRQALDAKIAGN